MNLHASATPFLRIPVPLPPVPTACAEWCHKHDVAFTVLEESATVNVGWWNHRLRRAAIPITVLGRGPDGEVVDAGLAEITRRDLWQQALFASPVEDSPFRWAGQEGSETADPGHLLSALVLIGAWADAHELRQLPLWIPSAEVHEKAGGEESFLVDPALQNVVRFRRHPEIAYARLSAAGIPWQLAAHLVAVFSVVRGARRVVPVDPAALRTVNQLRVLPQPIADVPGTWDYLYFQELVRSWAQQAQVAPELVELWLLRGGGDAMGTLLLGNSAPGSQDRKYFW